MKKANPFNPPFFSIIIATFNAEKTLERCLDSIINQRFADREILIQDGGSTDKTKNIVDAYHNEFDYFESYPDKGIYDAWNRALHHARGEWICFLGADDYLKDKNVLKNYSKFLKNIVSTNKIVYGINHIQNLRGDILSTIGKPWQEIRQTFYKTMCLPHPGMMHHRTIFDNLGVFDDSFKIAGDYEFLLRAFKNNAPGYWPNPVCVTPIGGISTLPKNNLICLSEIKRARSINGIEGVNLLWIKQWIGAIIRLAMWHTIGEKRSHLLLDFVRKARGFEPFWSRNF